jgi:hypothetical protein
VKYLNHFKVLPTAATTILEELRPKMDYTTTTTTTTNATTAADDINVTASPS